MHVSKDAHTFLKCVSRSHSVGVNDHIGSEVNQSMTFLLAQIFQIISENQVFALIVSCEELPRHQKAFFHLRELGVVDIGELNDGLLSWNSVLLCSVFISEIVLFR